MIEKSRIFVSHITDEALLAEILKTNLQRDFLGLTDIFVSSDGTSIETGINWLDAIDSAIKTAKIEIVLCSKASVKRPWINFEAGAGWTRGIPIVPVCHTGLLPIDLPMPLTVLQAIEANQKGGMERLYRLVARTIGSEVPNVDFANIVNEVKEFERNYSKRMKSVTQEEDQRFVNAIKRMKEALKGETHKLRTIERLAIIGGVSESEATDILRNDLEVVFTKAKSGRRVAKLKSK